MPRQIGITGNIGSGKTLISKIFSLLDIPLYNADSRAKWLMENDSELVTQLKSYFGPSTYSGDGKLNRRYLADVAFGDKEKVAYLNSLVHPAVAKDYKAWVENHPDAPYVLKEAALLFESGSYKGLDAIIVVYAPLDIRLKRTMLRDKERSEAQVRAINKNQWDDQVKMEKADYIIFNDDSKMVIPQVLELNKIFRLKT